MPMKGDSHVPESAGRPASPRASECRAVQEDWPKNLVKACKSGDPAATRLWSIRWVRSLAALQCEPDALKREGGITERAESVEQFARDKMSGKNGSTACAVTGAQFVIARAHGFTSWPALVNHIEALGLEDSSISAFERGAPGASAATARRWNASFATIPS